MKRDKQPETWPGLAALYRPLQVNGPEIIQLPFAQRQFYLSDHFPLCCTCWWWRCTNISTKWGHTRLFVLPLSKQKYSAAYIFVWLRKDKSICITRRPGWREGTQTTAQNTPRAKWITGYSFICKYLRYWDVTVHLLGRKKSALPGESVFFINTP